MTYREIAESILLNLSTDPVVGRDGWHGRDEIISMVASTIENGTRDPVPIRLTCPGLVSDGYGGQRVCGELHVDKGKWATKRHHTHSCQVCGHTWRPAVIDTVGVQFLPGFKDEDEDDLPKLVHADPEDARVLLEMVSKAKVDSERDYVDFSPEGNDCVGLGPILPQLIPIPQNKETKDQVASVMLQHGTPKQQSEAAEYAGTKVFHVCGVGGCNEPFQVMLGLCKPHCNQIERGELESKIPEVVTELLCDMCEHPVHPDNKCEVVLDRDTVIMKAGQPCGCYPFPEELCENYKAPEKEKTDGEGKEET